MGKSIIKNKQKEDKNALIANLLEYNSYKTEHYIEGAPHLMHKQIYDIYQNLIKLLITDLFKHIKKPDLLDLGAGEGTVTLQFLEYGFYVSAVDSSHTQLKVLQEKCKKYNSNLRLYNDDVFNLLKNHKKKYDVIAINSFLHHIPNYILLINLASQLVKDGGFIFTFQDPMRYDKLPKYHFIFSNIFYYSWRIFQGDFLNGLRRKIRRSKGIYYEDSIYDNAEYHVTRNGVDQDKLMKTLSQKGFEPKLIEYFSTQSSFFQKLGSLMKIKNTFGIIAKKVKIERK